MVVGRSRVKVVEGGLLDVYVSVLESILDLISK